MLPLKDNIPSSTKPFVNYLIIFINSVVFIYQTFFLTYEEQIIFIKNFGLIPKELIFNFYSSFYKIFTSMFLHGNFLHFFGNMWFLYIFGDNVEDYFGHIKYLLYYIIFGISATFLQFVTNPLSNIPMIGASGAISGILGAYFVFFPSAGVLTLVPFGFFADIVVLPAVLFLGIWFIFQFFSGTASLAIKASIGKDFPGVAYWAHIGGFVAGLLFAIKNRNKKRFKTSKFYF